MRAINRLFRKWSPFSSPFKDIQKLLPSYNLEVFVDIGANVGETTMEFIQQFPHSKAFCFEPHPETYHQLESRFKGNNNVHTYKLAFGNEEGELQISNRDDHTTNQIVSDSSDSALTIRIKTFDNWLKETGLETVQFIKIDTEGYDFKVLQGATEALQETRIDFVQVEAGMNAQNDFHVSYKTINDFLEPMGYFPFGIYNQCHELEINKPILRRADWVFISQKLAEKTEKLF